MDGQPALRILTREEHCLSRQTIDPDALKVLYRLQGHGFMAYLVGGCVRDLLLGKAPKDFDVVTNAHPQQIRELFRNSRLIGRRFRLAHVYFQGGKIIEVSTFRRRSEFDENGDNGHPRDDNTFGTPAEDALRRDITINGIFYNLSDFSLLDYVGGLEDLKQGTIRCIGDPEEKFMQDPVRMLRVIRHAARTGFSIEERTYVSLLRHVEKLRLCSPARVRDEFLRELKEGSVTESMRHMVATGMLWALFPPFVAPLADAGMRRLFFKLLEELDRLGADGTAADEVSLSLFLLPLIPFYCPFQDFPPGRRGQAAFQHKIRDWVLEVLGPHQFTRQAKEATAHLLGAQRIFHEFHPGGSFPRRFMQRSYFSQARQVFEIAARVQGDLPQVFPLECGAGKSVGRKRRRRRKKPRAGGVPQCSTGKGRRRPATGMLAQGPGRPASSCKIPPPNPKPGRAGTERLHACHLAARVPLLSLGLGHSRRLLFYHFHLFQHPLELRHSHARDDRVAADHQNRGRGDRQLLFRRLHGPRPPSRFPHRPGGRPQADHLLQPHPGRGYVPDGQSRLPFAGLPLLFHRGHRLGGDVGARGYPGAAVV